MPPLLWSSTQHAAEVRSRLMKLEIEVADLCDYIGVDADYRSDSVFGSC